MFNSLMLLQLNNTSIKDTFSVFLSEIRALRNFRFFIGTVSSILGYFHLIKFKNYDLLPL